jgi:hypothetical protein
MYVHTECTLCNLIMYVHTECTLCDWMMYVQNAFILFGDIVLETDFTLCEK